MSTFKFKCYQSLLDSFGKVDAIVECIELAIRDFEKSAKLSDNYKEYILQKSNEHNVKVNDVQFRELRIRSAQLHILNVYQQFEDYLESFRDEHPDSKDWKYPKDSKGLFLDILCNLNGDKSIISKAELDIIDYYRLMRNIFMHPEISSTKYDSKANKIIPLIKEDETLSKLNAPNVYLELDFDDFILFTRAVKKVAHKLCIVGRPSNEQIADTIKKRVNFKKYKDNSKRMKNALLTLCRCEYSMNEKEATEIVNILKEA